MFIILSALFMTSCGENFTCWCRCPPANRSLQFSGTADDCEDLCRENNCTFDNEEACSPSDVRACVCDDGLIGSQGCTLAGSWEYCSNCTAECADGHFQSCLCPDGSSTGRQNCLGGLWGECELCPTLCEDGASRRCQCDGNLEGQQTCADGVWSECRDCTAPAVCEDGAEEECSCSNDSAGTRSCESGAWSVCRGCYGVVYGDIDFGFDGMTSGGDYLEIVDVTEWDCIAFDESEEEMVWLLNINDGSTAETLWFEFDLPEHVYDLSIEYWYITVSDGSEHTEMEILINDVSHTEPFDYDFDCVWVDDHSYSVEAFNLGGTNRIEAWTRNTGMGFNHGLQGVWVLYSFDE